ncbi:DUF3347 domain-containing protein [Mangrovivirga sp. M17]|uniref:DUF3347 domain-containing protein n=1 Tax=Mangrovivirga halotolerans TaxID=2993936 RepID=A0ABT3RQK5_9BACT|nr:DUF3347 domain-containing protein [Mangrovivirga halotolerans]MCX2743911.1 DUF3347 domain-containing protein [Mangrovivirga halotolerans]
MKKSGLISGLSFLLVMSLFVMSCGGSSESETSENETEMHEHDGEMHENHEHNADMNDDHNTEGTEEISYEMNADPATAKAIVNEYLKIKNSLVESDREKTAEAAKSLHVFINENQVDKMEALSKASNTIANSSDIEQQRKAFEDLSEVVYKMIKSTQLDMPLYQQYCPMAFNNKGASWISSEKEVMNPYFGDKMLNCGKVTEEL